MDGDSPVISTVCAVTKLAMGVVELVYPVVPYWTTEFEAVLVVQLM